MIDLYNTIYRALATSGAYRAVVAEMDAGLPDWVVPLSSADRALLTRVAEAMQLREGETFADLACGLGGPGLWIARQLGAHVIGIDFSPVAIAHAAALARNLGMTAQATFCARDAARTKLPDACLSAAMSIDSLQFIDAQAGAKEIARILRPGGRAVITTWEALTDIEMPTVVRDYRPYFESAGLTVAAHAGIPGARDRELAQYRLLLKHAAALRAEIGDGAEPLLQEAEQGLRRGREPPRVRKVFIVAANGERARSARPATIEPIQS